MPPLGPPSAYSLSHSAWRPYQAESVSWGLDLTGIGLAEFPVGSGKTAFARAIASQHSALALVKTKNLQATVYTAYGFDVLYGRANYPCVHAYADPGDTCDTCIYDDVQDCPEWRKCLYVRQKEVVQHSAHASLNYAYYLVSRWPKKHPHEVLILDEAHLLSDLVLDYVGCRVTLKDIQQWYLGHPPPITSTSSLALGRTDPTQIAVIWLREALQSIKKQLASLKKHATNATVKKRLSRGLNLQRNLAATLVGLETNPYDWFIVSGPTALEYRGRPEMGFLARPLTARYHWSTLFKHHPTIICMSGTIGDFDTFATELGLKTYQTRRVPSNFPVSTRPIIALDVPPLSYKSTPSDYQQQAEVLAQAILACPSTWSGVIHVTRKAEAPLLAERLAHLGLQDRVWVTPDVATDQQMAAWSVHKQHTTAYGGQIALTWAWTEGVDLVDERICLTAKIPYPDTTNPYEQARRDYSPTFYAQRTAWTLQQELGRTRRGDESDYDHDGERVQLVGIADGSWRKLKKYLSPDFTESIVEGYDR